MSNTFGKKNGTKTISVLFEYLQQLLENVSKLIDYNNKHHGSNQELSNKLHDKTTEHIRLQDKNHITSYTAGGDRENTGSYRLNRALADGKEPHVNDGEKHRAILNHAKPTGHEFHVFSGTSRNFSELAKHSKGGILHLPAHTSVSHSYHVAKGFAENKREDLGRDDAHLLHIHVKPKDKVLHTSKLSEYESEHENIIPAGTKIKHTGTSEHDGIHIHHFTIHSQE